MAWSLQNLDTRGVEENRLKSKYVCMANVDKAGSPRNRVGTCVFAAAPDGIALNAFPQQNPSFDFSDTEFSSVT